MSEVRISASGSLSGKEGEPVYKPLKPVGSEKGSNKREIGNGIKVVNFGTDAFIRLEHLNLGIVDIGSIPGLVEVLLRNLEGDVYDKYKIQISPHGVVLVFKRNLNESEEGERFDKLGCLSDLHREKEIYLDEHLISVKRQGQSAALIEDCVSGSSIKIEHGGQSGMIEVHCAGDVLAPHENYEFEFLPDSSPEL